jgi:hypothetical protein
MVCAVRQPNPIRPKAARAADAVIRAYNNAISAGADESTASEQAFEAYRTVHPKTPEQTARRVVAAIIQGRT